jgi:SNF2 family DNA or RNA helicase
MLRRRKTDIVNGKPLIELPERHLSIVPCDFDEDERQFYFALENKIDEAMKKFVKNNEVMKNYTNVMVLLLRLRQGESTIKSTTLPFCVLMVREACNHPSLVSKDYNTDREAIESRPAPKDDQEDEDLTTMFQQLVVSKGKKCQLCQDEYISLVVSRFGHLLTSYRSRLTTENIAKDGDHCNDCIELARKARRKSLSPNKDSNLPPDSAKIRKLLELLKEIKSRENDEGEPTEEKTIVFSQFTTMLDLIQPFLKEAGIGFVRCELSSRL